MNMNKKTLYVAILLAALTACQKAEYTAPATLSDEPIRFGAPGIALDGELLSRAAGPVNEFPEGGSFGVLGYCLAMKGDNTDLDYSTGPDPWNSKAPRSTPHLFHKTEVAYNGSACYYTARSDTGTSDRITYTAFLPTIPTATTASPSPRRHRRAWALLR